MALTKEEHNRLKKAFTDKYKENIEGLSKNQDVDTGVATDMLINNLRGSDRKNYEGGGTLDYNKAKRDLDAFYGKYSPEDAVQGTGGTPKSSRDSNNYTGTGSRGGTGEELIDSMFGASRNSLVERLRESYNQQREAVQGEMSKVAPAYKAAKGDVLTQGKQAGKRLNELMRNQASGDVAQEQLQRNVATQQGVADLGRQEQETMDEYGQQLSQLKREEQAEINAGLSDLESQRMGALLDNYYKNRQFGMQEQELGLAKDKFDYQKYRDTVSDERYDKQYNDEMAYREWKKDMTENEFELTQDKWQFDKDMTLRNENREVAEFNARMNALTQPQDSDEFSILADLNPEQLEYYNTLSGRLSSYQSPDEAYKFVMENLDTIKGKLGESGARLVYDKITNFATGDDDTEQLTSYDDYTDFIKENFSWTNALGKPELDIEAVRKQISKWENRDVDENIVNELKKVYGGLDLQGNNTSGYNADGYRNTVLDVGLGAELVDPRKNSGGNVSDGLSQDQTAVIDNLTSAIEDQGYEVNNGNMLGMLETNKQYLLDSGLSQEEYNRLVRLYQ